MEELSELIKKRLIFVWRDAINASKDPDKLASVPHTYYYTDKGYFFLTLDGIKAIRGIIADIRDFLETAINFSDEYLEKAIDDAIIQLLPVKEKEILTAARKQVDTILAILATTPVDWSLLIPIVNLEMEMDNIRIGKVCFHKYDEGDSKKLQSRVLAAYEVLHKKNPSTVPQEIPAALLSNLKETFEKQFAKHVYAEVNMSAVDSKRAEDIAMQSLRTALDALYFYRLDSHFIDPFFAVDHFDVQGGIRQDTQSLILFSEKQISFPQKLTGFVMPFILTKTALSFMKANGLDALSDILATDTLTRTDFEADLITAIRFCALSVRDKQLANAFVNSVISLEALLMDEHEQISDNLSERVAFIIGQNLVERNGYFDEMKRLYGIRSKIVHSGNTDIRHSDLSLLRRSIAYRCIVNLLKSYKSLKITNAKDLIRWIREQKFS